MTAPAFTATVQSHPSAVDAYIRHGWSLVPIPMGTKGPRAPGWNQRAAALRTATDLPPGYGVGLAHAYSGTMALDIDDWAMALPELAAHGIDLQALYDAPDAVVIHSGKAGHGKLIYSMPFGAALPSKKIVRNEITVYELRCATSSGTTVQDVLPPSIHPETQRPYTWAGRGHWSRPPVIPQALLTAWTDMLDQDKDRSITVAGAGVPASWDEVQQALNHISPDCSREDWISCGMALHVAGAQVDQLDQALSIWAEWSKGSHKYPGDREILAQWRSFRTDKGSTVTLGTLFHLAKLRGWSRPVPDASSLFSATGVKAVVQPIDMLDGLRPKAPEMRAELWPAVLAQRASEVSESVGCDPLVPLFAGLAAVCGVIDAQIRLELMPGFKVPPVLWLMTLGDPADKKSPGSRPMLAPLRDIEAEDRPRFAREFLDYEGKEAAYMGAKKSFLEWSASADAILGGDQAPAVPGAPVQPVPLKITVSDVTSQKLVRSAADRPRGLLCYLDEMASWTRKMVDKTSGEDRSSWVCAYEAEPYEMDRVGSGSIRADNLAVSIYGNIQPRVFKENVSALSADGLLQRFIPAVLRPGATRLGHPIPEHLTSAAKWENTLRLIYSLPVQTYRLGPEAFQVFRDFQAWYESAKRDERLTGAGPEYMTAFGKLEGLTGRLILLFHAIEAPFSPTVSPELVARVIDLVRGYVIPAYRFTLGEVAGLATDSLDQWAAEHIIQHCTEQQSFTLRQLKRSARRHLDHHSDWRRDQIVMDAMLTLEQAGWVIMIESDFNKKAVTWAVNPQLPSLFSDYRASVIKAKQRQLDFIYKLSTKGRKHVPGFDPETMDE